MIILNDFAERALKRISPVYDESEFIRYFFNGVGVSFDTIRKFFKNFREQGFIETVDWGIEFQEHKYSLEPRPDLSLEERRRRLGIRAQIHRPINPARLEKAIYDYFGVKTYLYEKDPGYIRIFTNQLTEDGYWGMLDFLQSEKPAHLDLSTHIHIIEYGGGGELEDDLPIIPPDEDPPIPKTPEEKAKYPRIFAGVAKITSGSVQIDMATPSLQDTVVKVNAGVAKITNGEVQVGIAKPAGAKMIMHAGVVVNIGGEMLIDSFDKVVPPYIRENPTPKLAMAGGQTIIKNYNPTPLLLKAMRPQLMANEASSLRLSSSFGAIARGALSFTPPEDDLTSLGYDTVKIFFDFPISRHRRVRGIAMPNARQDLTRAQIQEVGQYAVDNKLIKNEQGEIATSVSHAALKLKTSTTVF